VTRPRLLDLFCGAGGAAMGYHRAGFEVVGVDIAPQPRYPFEFHQADALTYPLDGFDAVHASPPCQRWSRLSLATNKADTWPDLLPPVRARLRASGLPYVIENVPEAPLQGNIILLCGETFALPVIRHRAFETSLFLLAPQCCHVRGGIWTGRYIAFRRGKSPHHGRRPPVANTRSNWRKGIGCEWMSTVEAAQAIPPAYTEWIGSQLLAVVRQPT
jgi:hypothetical protein